MLINSTDFWSFVIVVAMALICWGLARKKKMNELIAIGVGLLFGLIGVIYYLLAKGNKKK